MDSEYLYEGDELSLFAGADLWRQYWLSQVTPFLGNSVLEVGAGVGSVTRIAATNHSSWVAVEPDAEQALSICSCSERHPELGVQVVHGTIADLDTDRSNFDAVLYADVLEHIGNDRRELAEAVHRVRLGGHVIVLVPAHQWLFSPFDTAVGHYRRYNRKSLSVIAPSEVELVRSRYLDSMGMLASVANRVMLRQEIPTERQVAMWNSRLVPISQRVDAAIDYRMGKSLLMVWRRRS